MADDWGKAREHRILMAEYLGRPLETWEQVHHRNGKRDDNRIENLELLSSNIHSLVTALTQGIKKLQSENERLQCQLQLGKTKAVLTA